MTMLQGDTQHEQQQTQTQSAAADANCLQPDGKNIRPCASCPGALMAPLTARLSKPGTFLIPSMPKMSTKRSWKYSLVPTAPVKDLSSFDYVTHKITITVMTDCCPSIASMIERQAGAAAQTYGAMVGCSQGQQVAQGLTRGQNCRNATGWGVLGSWGM